MQNMSKTEGAKICDDITTCPYGVVDFVINGYQVLTCQKCDHRYARVENDIEHHIRNNYNDDYFFGGKTGYPDYLQEKDIIIRHGRFYAKKINKIRKPGRILDVGCASGFLLKGFTDNGWSGKGIDPNQTMVDTGKKEMGLNLEQAYLEDYSDDTKYDLITIVQVIGHFANLDKALHKANELLNSKGLVLIESWNRGSFLARALGQKWHEYSPPTVLHWYTRSSLIELLASHGFRMIKKGKPRKYISLKHAFSLLEEKIKTPFIKKKINYFSTTFLSKLNMRYPPFDLFWMIFQKED